MLFDNYKRKYKSFQADFVWANVASVQLNKHFIRTKFDVISCMFALHYMFVSEDRAKRFFENVKELMQPKGCFIACFPTKEGIRQRMEESPDKARIGNEIYNITFPRKIDISKNEFGQGYYFNLEEAVNNTEEYLIDSRALKQLCDENGLVIQQEFPTLEALLQSDIIPKRAKDSFPTKMAKTARFLYLVNQRLEQGLKQDQNEFWDNIDDENINQVQDEQIQKITSLAQIPKNYRDVISLYQAVVITHKDPSSIRPGDRIQSARIPKPRRAVDICNLMDEQIDFDRLRHEFADQMWQPKIYLPDEQR